MTPVVVDSSVTLGLALPDEGGEVVAAVETAMRNGTPIFAPAHWSIEVANGVLMAERRKRITQADARAILDLIRHLPVQIDAELTLHAFDTISALARQYALTTYDAAYLELAMRRRASLATLDAALRKAALSSGVTVCV